MFVSDSIFNLAFRPDPFFSFFDSTDFVPNIIRIPRPPYTNRQYREEEPKV